MYCKKCGNKLPDEARFCKKCGNKVKKDSSLGVEEHSASNANDGNHVDKYDGNKRDNKKNNKKKKKGWKIVFWIILVVVLLGALVIVLDYMGLVRIPTPEMVKKKEIRKEIEEQVDKVIADIEIEHPDAADYYDKNAEIVDVIEAQESNLVQSEEEVGVSMTDRGFDEYPIWSEYSMEGEYYTATELSGSSEQHPIYQTYYVSANNELWTIFVINGSVMANPVSYNMQSGLGVQVIFSESNVITSYDSVTNKFYETIPNETELLVKVVEEINATTLDVLSSEEIDKYE